MLISSIKCQWAKYCDNVPLSKELSCIFFKCFSVGTAHAVRAPEGWMSADLCTTPAAAADPPPPPKPPEHTSPPPLRAQLSLFFSSSALKKKEIWTWLAALALSMFPFAEGSPEESLAMTWHRRSGAGSKRSPSGARKGIVLLPLQRSASSFHEICHVCRGARSFCCCCSTLLWLRQPDAGNSPPLTASSRSLQQSKVSLFLFQFAVSTPCECITCVDACALWGRGREGIVPQLRRVGKHIHIRDWSTGTWGK